MPKRNEQQKHLQKIERKRLAKMNYWQLLKEEDQILLQHEKLQISVATWDKVKWDGGRIFMSSFAISLWVVMTLVFTHLVGKRLPPIIANTPLIIAPYLIFAFIALSFADRLWHQTFTPFARTIARGLIHYWPATIMGIVLIFI